MRGNFLDLPKIKQMANHLGSQKSKIRTFLKWNGEIKPGDIVTTVAVLIAFLALLYQRKDLETKVDDLQAVINKLDKEKSERELEGQQLEYNRLQSFNRSVELSTKQIAGSITNSDIEFMSLFGSLNKVIKFVSKRNALTPAENAELRLLHEEGNVMIEVNAHELEYHHQSDEFTKRFGPRLDNFSGASEYVAAQKWFVDSLQKNESFLLRQLDSAMKTPQKRLQEISDSLLQAEARLK
jgi:hypothetical protein